MAKKRTVKRKKSVKSTKKRSRKKTTKRTPGGFWSSEDVKLLKKRFATNPTSEIARQLGRATDAVKKKAARMGLRKSKAYMKKLGRG